jgi:hypothetical protein
VTESESAGHAKGPHHQSASQEKNQGGIQLSENKQAGRDIFLRHQSPSGIARLVPGVESSYPQA